MKKIEEFHLLYIHLWEWSKTENLNDSTTGSYYDHSPGGRLLSGYSDCPSCQCLDSVIVAAGYDGDGNCDAREWHCLSCGSTGEILGCYGELPPEPDDDHDEYMSLPECVVVKYVAAT